MKQIKIWCMTFFTALVLVGCGAEKNDSSVRDSIVSESSDFHEDNRMPDTVEATNAADLNIDGTEKESVGGSNILIAYFSVPEDVDTVDAVAGASIVVHDNEKLGNTEYVAKLIQQTIGGDLFRIETVDAYPLDHDPLVDQAADEQDENKRPALLNHVENFDQYETVILGFPNWWADLPMPVYTFLEEYDFGAKTIIPFVTHGGSGFSGTLGTISELQPGAHVSENTLSLSRNSVADSETTVVEWAQSLGLNAVAVLPGSSSDTVTSAKADPVRQQVLAASDLPLTYFCYGTRDPFVGEFEECVEALTGAGIPVTVNVLDGRPHGYQEGRFLIMMHG